ncbi:MAG: hypothetical protein DHS80DRAFT_30327 [Piptocephalis tieghemiana]|nr:MAG: hypothetical protein DHS80DRAFT_30327 [Piptocephalis tieghemiana]
MRILTHNMLQCHAVGCTSNNFPLRLEELQIERDEVEVNAAFLVGLLPKLDWPALVATAEQLGFAGLPDTIPEEAETNEAFLEQLNSVLLETHIQEGRMVCNGCGHVYRIKDGIPNMLLSEHEV